MNQKITFVTRHYPPSANINGESVRDMVKYLSDKFQIESNVICIDKYETGGGADRNPVGNVVRLKSIFQNRGGILRFVNFLYDGFSLIRASLKFKDTLIICTTSPPLLPFWASLLFNNKIRWALWTLDLFPEGFHVTKRINKNNFFYKWVYRITYENRPSFLITLGEEQAKHLNIKYKKEIPSLILPCGVFFFQDRSNDYPDWKEKDKLCFGYCGNINDAHNPDIIKAVVDNIDPNKHQIVLALYGSRAEELKSYVSGKPGVKLVTRVPREQLHFIDIHIVSLRKEWTHIAVPSKAVSAIFMGGTILFCGDEFSDNWQMFKESGWFIDENDKIRDQVSDFFSGLTSESVNNKKTNNSRLITRLQNHVLDSYTEVAKRV